MATRPVLGHIRGDGNRHVHTALLWDICGQRLDIGRWREGSHPRTASFAAMTRTLTGMVVLSSAASLRFNLCEPEGGWGRQACHWCPVRMALGS